MLRTPNWESDFSLIWCVGKQKCTDGARLVRLASLARTYGFAAGKDIQGLLAMANGPKENLEKRSENSLFLMLYVLLYIC